MLRPMTTSRSVRRFAPWAVPAVTVATVAVVTALPSTATASAHPNLPARTPGQLLAALETSDVQSLSGTVVESARLGLPDLPGADSASGLSPQVLATGTHTVRVWLDGPERQRIALLGQLAESDVVHNGRDLWTYDSNTQKVGHTTLPARSTTEARTPAETRHTPQDVAAEALKAIDPSTQVTVDRTARVAGRPVYTLVLAPRDSRSTVREVAIALDAERKVPLRVQVFGRATKPAFEIAFTDVSFTKPSASVFRFTPPKGATVTSDLFGTQGKDSGSKPDAADKGAAPKAIGTGWTTVLALPAGSSPLAGLSSGDAESRSRTTSLLNKLTTTLPGGDRVLHTALVNVLTTKDGRTFVGAVSVEVLQRAASGQLG